MKIDFLTHYRENEFEGLCETAISLGLEALVMEGFTENRTIEKGSLLIFPAQEVAWKAALEIPFYKSESDYRKRKITSVQTHVFRGRFLVLLPENVLYLKNPLYSNIIE